MKTLKSIVFLQIFILHTVLITAQNEAQKWYFGNQAGLDFATNPPTVLTNGMMTTAEGCASISDANGNLLFYTDGITVYNQTHTIMANGIGLMGNGSTTQSSIIVKQPGNSNIYYIFTQGATASINGFCYSIVDMNLAAGLGSVTVINALINTPSCEKIAAVRHCNGVDTWIISHDYNSNTFRATLLTAAGLSSTPVLSSIGSVIQTPIHTLGQLKVSPNGKKIGLTIYDTSIPMPFELYDFDQATGVISNLITLQSATSGYGCEFSPDGSKFYGSLFQTNQIYQWDLCAGSNTAIVASQYLLSSTLTSVGSLQLAIDGKIYVALAGKNYLGEINNPNLSGASCNYNPSGISIAPKMSMLGLPNFISGYFNPKAPPFTYSVSCQNTSFTAGTIASSVGLCSSLNNPLNSIQWIFGDPASGAANSSTLNNPSHSYSSAGNYTVKCIYYFNCSTDTVILPVNITNLGPTLSVAGTFTICKKEKRVYTTTGASSYSWSTGASTNSISLNPTTSGTFTYMVTGLNSAGCSASKIFTVTVNNCNGFDVVQNNLHVNIYPIPANDLLVIETDIDLDFELLNQNGQLLRKLSTTAGKNTFDITDLKKGIYMLKTKNHAAPVVFKVVKIE
ncbi:MAG: T9SS type A sorting domain-containing protein [Bacteroidia bacterium]|nr:T9SS type A sorting domain-containing protein [Bacteroidia bacterium]